MKVSLFATCLVDMFQGNAGKSAVELLERLGCEIDFPETQVSLRPACIQQRLCEGIKGSHEKDDHSI